MLHWIGTFTGNPLYLMVKTVVSCRLHLKPIQWMSSDKTLIFGSNLILPYVDIFGCRAHESSLFLATFWWKSWNWNSKLQVWGELGYDNLQRFKGFSSLTVHQRFWFGNLLALAESSMILHSYILCKSRYIDYIDVYNILWDNVLDL